MIRVKKKLLSQDGQGTERAAYLLMDVKVTENDDNGRKKDNKLIRLLINEGVTESWIMTSETNEWQSLMK